MSARAALLIASAATALHTPTWATILLLVGYALCEKLDRFLSQRAKTKLFASEMDGWEPDPEEPGMERKGDTIRACLTGQQQIVWYRLADLLRRAL